MNNEHFMGTQHVWWMGIVENRNDPLNIGRCQVRFFGWNTDNKAMLPTEKLIWAHPAIPLGSKTIVPPPEGTMVKGFFMDGDAGQHPIMEHIIPGIPDTAPDTSKGFSDPRTDEQLQNAPRPPASVDYPTTGKGVTVNEAPQAQRYPIVLNEPTSSRLTRNENISQTIVARKNNNRDLNVGVATGGVTIDAGVDVNLLLNERALLLGLLPKSVTNLINKFGNIEICGLSINALLPSGVLVGGISIQAPVFVGGEILIGGLALLDVLANGITLSAFANLQVDVFGCIIGPGAIGGAIHLDGGLKIPLLSDAAGIVASIPGLTIGATVHGGVKLGTMGGIPLATSANWNEPQSFYNAKYPYNHVHESESGHVVEIDDTPGHERLHRFHRAGTFEEIGPDGTRVTKVVKNDYHVVMSDNNVHVMGDCNVTVSGNRNEMTTTDKSVNTDGNHTSLIKGDETNTTLGNQTNTIAKTRTTTITENENTVIQGIESHAVNKDYNIVVLGDYNVIVKGKGTIAVQGDCNLMVSGDCTTSVGGNMIGNVLGDADMTIEGDSTTTVQGDMTATVQGDLETTTIGQQTFNADGFTFNALTGSFAFNALIGNFLITAPIGNFLFNGPAGTFQSIATHTNIIPLPNH